MTKRKIGELPSGNCNRRRFLKISAAAVAAAASSAQVQAADDKVSSPAAASSDVPVARGVTRALASYIVNAQYGDLPANVRKEGTRTLMNWVGVAVGGSGHEAVGLAVAALAPFAGPPQAALLGRRERFDILNAAFVNGVSSHVFDFDDTHLRTIIHPAGPVMSAILPLSEYHPVSGKDFLNALVLGVETECRIGNAISPNHLERGWHITGIAGVFGAAAAAGKILGLTEQQMVWALGLAASQPVGLLSSSGTMSKSFDPGRAGGNGLFAALLASRNFTSADNMLEAERGGWAKGVSSKQEFREITDGLGQRYEAALNTYKPFACGIVAHPAIDAAIRLRNEYGLTAGQIEAVDLRVNSYVLEATGKKSPQTGLEGKFSVYHSVAVAIVYGAAGEKQYSDRVVQDPAIVVLRDKVKAAVDPAIKRDQVDMTITLKDGRRLHQFIEHAIGSADAPMTDRQLEAKFAGLAEGILPKEQAVRLMETCWQVEQLPNAGTIAKTAVPAQVL